MNTQRVNAYIAEEKPVFYIEEYDAGIKDWLVVGETYDQYVTAEKIVGYHNTKLVADKLEGLK